MNQYYFVFCKTLSGLFIFDLLSIIAYYCSFSDGLLFNICALAWMISMLFGILLIMFHKGRTLFAIIYGISVCLYGLAHNLTTYSAHLFESSDDMFNLLVNGVFMLLMMICGLTFSLSQLKEKEHGKINRYVKWILLVVLIVLSLHFTHCALDGADLIFDPDLEYTNYLVACSLFAMVNMAFASVLMRENEIIHKIVIFAAAMVIAINCFAYYHQINTAFAASRANDAEMSGIQFSDVFAENALKPGDDPIYSDMDGNRGLFVKDPVDSKHYKTDLSLAMLWCGYVQPKSSMKVAKDAGNWHENTNNGVICMYDLYQPADTDKKTPVVISLHGYGASREYIDMFALMCDMGYTVIDAEYGMDSENLHNGTVNSAVDTDRSNKPQNYDYWAADMEHLFRYLKQHEEELNIDLNCVFLLGHSYGSYMCVAIDNLLLGAGHYDWQGNYLVERYDRYADYYSNEAESDPETFIDIRGMILMYGVAGTYFADGLDPILSAIATGDGVVRFDSARQVYKLRATNKINHFYILDAGTAAHGFDAHAGNELDSQIINQYIEMFMNRFGKENKQDE